MKEGASSPIVVAKITKPHGIGGEVVLESLTDVQGRFEEAQTFLLLDHGEFVDRLAVESHRFFGGRHVLKFVNISDRSKAEKLRGKELAIPQEELGSLPSDHYFIDNLIGMTVLLRDGTLIGHVKGIMKTGGVDLLKVGDKDEILIPFASDICVEVDMKNNKIIIDPPQGLLQLNAR